MIVHLIVAQLREVHLHHEDVPDARDRRAGNDSPQHPRAVEVAMLARVRQDLENRTRWRDDPPRYGYGLVLSPGHERASFERRPSPSLI
jgi:hypothetical protein